MKKKLALAAALLPNPDLLFLDEPFEGVDAVTSRVIRDMLTGYVSRGSTLFLTSHVLEIVERLCTHVGIIAHGELVEQASLDEIRQGSSLESSLPGKSRQRFGRLEETGVARRGRDMTWQHFRTLVWLRRRLFRNRMRRAGKLNAVVTQILHGDCDPRLGRLVFRRAGVGHLASCPRPRPIMSLFIWTGLTVTFLFAWIMGVMTELQRSEVLSIEKLFHYPISPGSAFLVNYLSSLVCVSLILFFPAMLGLAIASVVALGPWMLISLPLLLGFVLMVTAVTYQFRGWLATLMVNKRRRRTIVACITGRVYSAQPVGQLHQHVCSGKAPART